VATTKQRSQASVFSLEDNSATRQMIAASLRKSQKHRYYTRVQFHELRKDWERRRSRDLLTADRAGYGLFELEDAAD
jgi:hypothetical protein